MAPVLTAKVGRNADLFNDITRVYFKDGARVLDSTWGRGNFWNEGSLARYNVVGMDLVTPLHIQGDVRNLPFREASFDAMVLDPPYAKRVGTSIKASIAAPYQLDHALSPTGTVETMAMYHAGAYEALHVLRVGGYLILKCQDEIESGKQRWNHVALLHLPGFVCEDLFVMVQQSTPAMRVPYQLHARKNHSYFLVHRKQ